MLIWLDFFLQVFVQALAWTLAASLTVIPAGYLALKRFQRWRRATRVMPDGSVQ